MWTRFCCWAPKEQVWSGHFAQAAPAFTPDFVYKTGPWRGRGGGLLGLRPTHPKKILTQNLAEGKSNLNKQPFVGPTQTHPLFISIPYRQSLLHTTFIGNWLHVHFPALFGQECS